MIICSQLEIEEQLRLLIFALICVQHIISVFYQTTRIDLNIQFVCDKAKL